METPSIIERDACNFASDSQGLDPMHQGGTVRLVQQVVTHLHDVVGPDTEEVLIGDDVLPGFKCAVKRLFPA